MIDLETIKIIAHSLQATADPDTTYGKAILDAIAMSIRVVESAQHVQRNQDQSHQIAKDAWNLVYLIITGNNRQGKGKASERQYRELVEVLEDAQTVFSTLNAAQYSSGQRAQDFEEDVIGGLREKLFQCLQQFNFTSFDEVRQSADDLAITFHTDLLLGGTSRSVAIGDNANLSQSKGNAIGFNNMVINTSVINPSPNISRPNNFNANVQGSNEVHAGSDYRNYGGVTINNQVDLAKHDEILNRLRRAPAQYSSFKGDGGCMPGTRTSVLEQAMMWASSLKPDDPPIFWLHGSAGTGKSTIAYSVAEQCSELTDHLSASFFFTYTNGDCSDARLFFSTIAYQLASLNPELKAHIANHIKTHLNPEDIRPEVQLVDLIIRPLSDFGNKSPIVIVVDALDECTSAGASEILRLLSARISKLPFRLKFFITSRSEPHIRAKMESDLFLITYPLNLSRDVDPSLTDIDIRHFLVDRLHEGARQLFGSITSWLKEKDIDTLVYQSGGLFIYAATAAKFILDGNFRNPRAQLEKLLHVHPQAVPGLDAVNALYLRVLQGALPDGAGETLKEEFRLVLGAIIVIRETLSRRTLEALLGLNPGTVGRILSGLHSVISIPDNEDDGIRTVHPSFLHYLTNRESFTSFNTRFFIDPAIYHAHIAKYCFGHMKTSLKQNICEFEDFPRIEITTENAGQSELISQRIAGVVKYACRHFAAHLYTADINICALDQMLADWAYQRLTYWLEVLVLLGSLSIVLPSLTLLSKWLEKFNEARAEVDTHPISKAFRRLLPSPRPRSELNKCVQSTAVGRNVRSLFRDAARMVSEFFDTIKYMPSQIYTSCVFFAPTQSTFHSSYSGQCSEMQFLHGRFLNWSTIAVLHTFKHEVSGLAFSSDGWILASSLKDGTIHSWNLDSGGFRVIDGAAEDPIHKSVFFSPDGKYIATRRQIYDVETGKMILRDADCVAFSSDGRYIALTEERDSIDSHDPQGHPLRSHPSELTGSVPSLIFSPDGKWIASASRANNLCVWSMEESREATCLARRESMKLIHSLTFSPDGAYLAFCDDRQVFLWVMAERTELRLSHTFDGIGHDQQPVFSPDSRTIAWVTHKRRITTVQLDVGVVKKPYRYLSNGYYSVVFSPNGKTILAGGDRGEISLLRLGVERRQARETVHRDGGDVIGIISSSSSGYYASWSSWRGKGSICVWEVDKEALPTTQMNGWHDVWLAAFAPDGKSIAAIFGFGSHNVGKLDALTGQRVLQWKLSDIPHSIEFSSDSRYLATSHDSHIKFWLWDTGKRFKFNPTPHSGTINGYAFSPDAAYIALCYDSQKLYVVNLKQHAGPILLDNSQGISSSTLTFSPDCHLVAAITLESEDIVVWEVTTGKLNARAQTKILNKELSFSPDGQYIAYQGREGIHVWAFLRGESEGRIISRTRANRLSFSPLNQKFVAAVIEDCDDLRAILVDVDRQEKVTETAEFSSYRAFMREFGRRGRFLNYPSSSNQGIQDEDRRNYPYMVDEEGWVRTTASRPLCRLPKSCRPDSRWFKWGSKYDTNGNRIVFILAARTMILIQFGTQPICENHPPLRMGTRAREEVMPYY